MPGDTAWSDANVACGTTADCGAGEVCVGSVCRMQRCQGTTYVSKAPIGLEYAFFSDREILVADVSKNDSSYWVDSYGGVGEPAQNSWRVGSGAAAKDIAGGRFYGLRPEAFASAFPGDTHVHLQDSAGHDQWLDVGMQPIALAAGDVDGDKIDELIVAGPGGKVAICHVPQAACTSYSFSGAPNFLDVTAADIDGDGFDEPVLLVDLGSQNRRLMLWNLDAALTGQPAVIAADVASTNFVAVAAGDLDGDGNAEVAFLEDRGYLGLLKDYVHVYSVTGDTWAGRSKLQVDADTVDLAIGDTNSDRKLELLSLHNSSVEVYDWQQNALASVGTIALASTGSPTRLALADTDGDSPSGKLVEGPTLVSGKAVPTMVVTFPPYDHEHSSGVGEVDVGRSDTTSNALTDTISLSLGVTVGVDFGIDGLFRASLSDTLSVEMHRSKTIATTMSVGNRLVATPQTDVHGFQYGGVVMSCGCFHRYTYQLSDPRGKMGGDGKHIALFIPVGGQTTLWSTPRYNAMAKAVGDLPQITVPTRIGDPKSYPTEPTRLDGTPVPPADLVFTNPPSFTVSDAASIGWSMGVGQSTTNEQGMSVSLSIAGSIDVAGLTVGASLGGGWGRSYSVTVGSDASFSGSIPPLPDNPNTPEDEYKTYGYSFKPIVYKQPYTDGTGAAAAFYVVTYTVQR